MKATWIGIAIVVLVGIGLLVSSRNKPAGDGSKAKTPVTTTDNNTTPGTSNGLDGTVIFSVTDKTAEINNVSEVTMNVDRVQLYNETKGWVDVSSDTKAYKLLDLKARSESQLYAKATAAADTYSRVKVTLKDVVVTTKSGAKKQATLPKRTLEMASTVMVKADATTSVHLDVLADQSLHETERGNYVFAPVVTLESRSDASVETDSAGVVTISDGSVDSSTTLGMDLSGEMKVDFHLDGNLKLQTVNGAIQIIGGAKTDLNLDSPMKGSSVEGMIQGAVGN